jgi:predicted nucleic acid-binding protein
MNVFIDTNIYLKFYHYSNAELEELKKLIVLIEEGEVKLFITRQVINEYTRNRETKIADALKTFREEKLNGAFPAFFKEYEEFDNMRKAVNDYQKNKKNLLDKIVIEIDNHALKADSIMNELIVTAGVVEQDNEIIQDAKQRFDLGNPPGKNNSYGDALNWLTLMRKINIGEDLHFLSDDKDFFSEIDNTKFNNYLLREWRLLKASNLYFFKSLPDFFKHNYPDIKLASDIQKDIYIERLKVSVSFRDSRYYLNRLASCDDFTSDQINRIIEASLDNYQIYWISNDFDINEILYNFIDKYGINMDDGIKQRFMVNVPKIKQLENE